LIAPGRPAESEIDSTWIKRLERAELFRNDERCVIGKHDTAGAHPDALCSAGDIANHHRGRSAGDAGHVVMFGEPVAMVAPGFGVLCQIERVTERFRVISAFTDGGQIENGEAHDKK
jgi:hypothetical protein